ncbi:ribonuclease Z [Pseudonocardia eucalypti]|uniref:Ribonuclease Z n=1 Tax=Pseudonocardia eucalypti TaxID=648755 RepID=A0ABP9QNB3_9PSEU|nr:ribonuclease Z [Pseudonocardia eucalypti]
MSVRELVVLGTASQAPTRTRNHNGYFLRWDGDGLLFDPGEGTQRQLLLAGVPSSAITHICLTHFHGDHCLGLPGVIQRMSLDGVAHPVHAHYPASGQRYFERLRHATVFHDRTRLHPGPIERAGVVAEGAFGRLEARGLDHPVDAYGYRLVEPDGVRMRPELLERFGLTGADIGRLRREGSLARADGGTVMLAEVSRPRPGQRFAFVMDTRLCDAVYELADGVDMLVIESTFLRRDAALARDYGHLTSAQAGEVARDCGVRRLVLTHFSQRYRDAREFAAEAAEFFDGDIVLAEDLATIPLPPRP